MSMGAPEPCTEDRSRDFTKSRFTRGPYTDVPPKGLPVGPAPSVFFVVAATEFEPKGWMIEPRERTSDFSNSICKARANWRIENMATTISNRSGGSLSAGVVNYHDVAGSAQPAGTAVPSLGLNSTQL